ncbi:hypothetical protein [Arthrobacter sp. NPDC057259]|uniref:hypothetical protein n=1 Tax=Arthrobacter sp. NPDC057259 TaxID=3346073 RepID=UPI003636B162
MADIAPLAEADPAEMAKLLEADEVTAPQRRGQRMMLAGSMPVDRTGMRYPRPLV